MSHQNLHVAVLKGGVSSEREVSLKTGAAVANALTQFGHHVQEIDVQTETIVCPPEADFIFNCLHGTFGEDGKVQAFLAQQGKRFNGCGARACELAFDKKISKEIFDRQGIPTPKWAEWTGDVTWTVPFVLKPQREGSSVGVFLVREIEQVGDAVRDAKILNKPMLIEQMVVGTECTVGILGEQVLPVVEIRPKLGFYDYHNKYTSGATEYLCPCTLKPEIEARVQEVALAAYKALGCQVYSRVDVMLNEANDPYVLEVNTIPGMTALSLLPMAAKAKGMTFPELCQAIIDLSWDVKR